MNNKSLLILTIASLLSSWGVTPATAQTEAQEDANTEISDERARIEATTALLTAEAGLITAENALQTARITQLFGSTAATGQAGTITADTAAKNTFAQLLVYNSLEDSTDQIIKEVCQQAFNPNHKIHLASAAEFSQLQNARQLVDFELEALKDSSETIRAYIESCLLYTSPSPRDLSTSRMPSSA